MVHPIIFQNRLGIYLEVEMPMWGKDAEPDEKRYDFFRREQKAILMAVLRI